MNKPLQERTSTKFWMTEKLLKFCFGLLGFFSQILLRSNEEKHIILVFEKITQTFLDLNSTFFLDNSIKVVTNYNQNQFNTLQRFEKFQMMSKMLKNLLKNVEKAQIFKISILKNKSFEDFILGTYMIFGISLFFFDSKNKDLIQIFKQLEILHLNFIKNKINTSGNYKYMKENQFSLNFNETNSLFECFFFGKCENNNVRQKNNSKILKNMIKNFHENSKNMKQIWKYFDDFFSFILKYLRLETLTVNNSNNVLKNCLILMRHSLNFLENNQENTTKILKIHQDFVTFLFKRPKFAPLEMMFQIPQGWDEVCKSLIKYLCIFSKCLNLGLLKSDEDLLIKLLGTILEQEMKSFENKNISFIKLLETVLAGAFQGHLNKINLILRITEKYFRNQEDNNNIAFSFIQTIFYAFFKENGYKYQPFFIFVLIIEQINYLFGKDIKELQVYSLVFADILQKIDFRFIMKLYDGKNFETDGFKSLEMYLRISRNLLNSLFSFSGLFYKLLKKFH